MNNESNHTDNLIARYLAGEASAEEREELLRWMESSPENKKYVEGIEFIHEKAVASRPYVRVDVDKAWQRVNSLMDAGKSEKIRSLHKRSWFPVAASLAVLAVLSVLLYFLLLPSIPDNKVFSLQSDDSIITRSFGNIETTLNRHSEVVLTFRNHSREKHLSLTGEAFFRVNQMDDTVLIVSAGETFIRDIGTSFNVRAYTGSKTVEVYVTSGEVVFYTEEGDGIHVMAGETGFYDNKLKEFRKTNQSDLNATAYQSKQFVFRNTPVREVITALNRVYDQKFELDRRISGQCSITVTFSNEQPDEIAGILSETLGLELVTTDSAFILKGESCSGQP